MGHEIRADGLTALLAERSRAARWPDDPDVAGAVVRSEPVPTIALTESGRPAAGTAATRGGCGSVAAAARLPLAAQTSSALIRHSCPVRLVVTNEEKHDIQVGVEPWGDFVMLKPGDSIGVICSDTTDGYVNLVLAPSQLDLWAEGDRDLQLSWIDARRRLGPKLPS